MGTSLVTALGALCLSTVASASLIVIGSKDININQLNDTQLSSIYMGKSVSLPTGETLNPIDQDSNSSIYNAFYQQIAGMDASSVNSYWSQLTFSGTGSQPPEVESDRAAIASVENSHKAIAYIDSGSLGPQVANVKVLYGTLTPAEQNAAQDASDQAPTTNQQQASGDDAALRSQLSNEIAELKAQQARYQQLNDERQQALISILRSEQNLQKKHREAIATISASPKDNVALSAPTGLWSAMTDHFQLSAGTHNAAVNQQVAWYLSHKWVLNMIIKNSEPYLAYVYQQTQKRGMPAEFALLPMVESGYMPFAHSPAGAQGLWQIMPNTASSNGLKVNWWYDGRLDIVNSTNAALDDIVRLHGGLRSWELAAAAYNYGEGGVLSALDYNKRKGLPTDYWALPLPQETKNYLPKLLALAEIIRHPSKYGITLPALTTQPNFATVKLNSQIDRAQIADLADTSEDVVHQLNPGMLRWATAPHQSYELAIPTDKLATFKINLARLANQKRLLWVYHNPGSDSLATIAKQYHTSVKELQRVNELSSDTLVQGQGIVVPIISDKTYAGIRAAVQGSTAKLAIAKSLAHADVTPLPQHKVVVTSNRYSVDAVSATGLLNDSYKNQSTASTSTAAVVSPAAAPQPTGNDLKALMNKLYE